MKEIKDFPNYCITDNGDIWSKKRLDKMGRPIGNCWLKPKKNRNGYLEVCLYKNNRHYWRSIHRLVLLTFVGECPENMETRHLNGIKTDNRLNNLEWNTKRINTNDTIEAGSNKGERNGSSKLTNKEVLEIKKHIKLQNKPLSEIAREFNVSYLTIYQIKTGVNWRWLK